MALACSAWATGTSVTAPLPGGWPPRRRHCAAGRRRRGARTPCRRNGGRTRRARGGGAPPRLAGGRRGAVDARGELGVGRRLGKRDVPRAHVLTHVAPEQPVAHHAALVVAERRG